MYYHLGRAKRIWYLSPMRAAKVQASLRIRAVSPEPPLLAHTSSESRGTFRQKTRSLAPLNGWACAVKVCHDGMLEDTNSLGGAHFMICICTLVFTVSQFHPTVTCSRTRACCACSRCGTGGLYIYTYIFHLSSISNVMSFGRRLNMTEIL